MVLTLAQELESSFLRIQNINIEWGPTYRPQKYFEWIRLKKICEKYGLEDSYDVYSQRIYRNYLKSFMRFHVFILFLHGIAVIMESKPSEYYFYDSIIYFVGAVLVCLCLAPYMNNYLVKRFPVLPYIVSILASFIMAITDCLPSIVGLFANKDIFNSCYNGYTISVIYLFMPMKSVLFSILLGLMITLIYSWNSYNSALEFSEDDKMHFQIRFFIPDLLFMLGLNIVGIIAKTRHEFKKRKVFLTKSLNVEENLLLKYTKAHEGNLLHTIIPAQIAKKIEEDIKSRIEKSKFQKLFRTSRITETARKLFIKPHYNVSILFADVVNYTYLTTKLDVKTLVETLHELFQRFDSACDQFNCMRIKFLGDCYYCVSGVPESHPFHALCCIELGRSIIKHVKEVRASRSLDIDMRIGVHSGNILSGIIGTAKWQYDIWSKDVNIASTMENTGVPGRVHVSSATLNLTEGYYEYEDGTEKAKNHSLLQKNNIKTYLIIGPSEFMTSSGAWRDFLDSYQKSPLSNPSSPNRYRRAFNAKMSQSKKMDYDSIRQKANAEIGRKVHTLPMCKLSLKERCFERMPRLAAHQMEDHKANQNITTCCLWYENVFWETKFNNERDEYLKMSVLGAVLLLWCIMGMQAANKSSSVQMEGILTIGLLYSSLFVYSIYILFTAWFRTICNKLHGYPLYRPRKKITRFFYRASINFESRCVHRTLIFISLVICLLVAATVHLMSCNEKDVENDEELIQEFLSGGRRVLCFSAWPVTDCIILCLALIMTFSHIPHCLSFTLAIFVIVCYTIMLFFDFSVVYEASISTNHSIRAEYSHFWSIVTVFFIYYLMNRHVVFISRVDTYTKWHVNKKRQDARLADESINVLLHNILPSHVVDIYLSKRLRNEPYYEKHDFVAVMFATIIYSRSGSIELRLLNEIICDFDEILEFYKGSIKVEKIKVANWSYMAACGFNVFRLDSQFKTRSRFPSPQSKGRGGSSSSLESLESLYKVFKRRKSVANPLRIESSDSSSTIDDMPQRAVIQFKSEEDQSEVWKEQQRKKVLSVMTHFALDLLHRMRTFNSSNQLVKGTDEPVELRIGISCGEVMAGVVGSSQAHYDIWGNAVNMASRMDSTGVPGRIQVTADAAEMLESINISCTYRGETFVKGRGNIPTYFVDSKKDTDSTSSDNSLTTFKAWWE